MFSSKRTSTLVVRLALIGLPLALVVTAVACADSADPDPGTGTPTATSTAVGGSGGGICLLNNCTANEHCAGCSEGRNTCLVAEQRCVACDPNQPIGQQGCPDGQECSPYGICVPQGLTCPVDSEGVPTVVCSVNADCQACSPMHQVCDPQTHKCQACTETNTQHCTQSDICIDGKCSPKCPPSCQATADCQYCGGPGNEAHACFKHKCAQCTDAPEGDPLYYPCPSGQVCDNGVCVPPCGIPGPVAGNCAEDEDCHYCGGADNYGSYTCKTPLNSDHGVCVPGAEGCEDLAPGLVLPEPWSDYTNTCSNDDNCNNVGIQYDVGQQIRDWLGSDSLDLGFTDVKICNAGDAANQPNKPTVDYDMSVCASIEIVGDAQCGLCVPCAEDSDCQPIDVDPLIPGLFCESAIATIAGALLIDLLWGDDVDHHLNFFCQDLAAGYGVCVPCANPFSPCASGGGGGSGNCDHGVCEEGGPLDPSCGTCEAAVCNEDQYCCDTAWDATCVAEVDDYCAGGCGGSSSCAHTPCDLSGGSDPLSASCSPCTQAVCSYDDYCCTVEWDQQCVDEAQADSACDNECSGGCAHDECVEGAALTDGCSQCVTDVCADDPYCCTNLWDNYCIDDTSGYASCPACS